MYYLSYVFLRLNPPEEDEPDLCVFVGENVTLSCMNSEGMSLVITGPDGNVTGDVMLDGTVRDVTFMCDHQSDSPCADQPAMVRVRVYG